MAVSVGAYALGDDRATVTASKRPEAGSFAFLVRNGIKVPSLVAWTAGTHIGLSFEEGMDEAWRENAFKGKC